MRVLRADGIESTDLDVGLRFIDHEGVEYRCGNGYQFQTAIICCDCGLAHRVEMEHDHGEMVLRFAGDEELTAEVRARSGVAAPERGACTDRLAKLVPELDQPSDTKEVPP